MTEDSKQVQDQQTEPSIIVEGVLPDTNVVQARQCYSPEGVAPSCVAGEGTGSRTKIVEDSSDSEDDPTETLPDIPEGGCAPMLTPGREVKRQNGRRFKEDGEESFTLTAADKHGIATRDEGKLRIRYLTPVECFRLMGFTDDEIAKMMAVEQSKSRLYKMAGNSIVVDVLAAIFHNIYIEPTFERGAKVKTLDDFFGGN